VLLVGTPISLSAQDKAEDLLWNCSGQQEQNAATRQAKLLHCLGYLQGAHDMLRLVNDLIKLKPQLREQLLEQLVKAGKSDAEIVASIKKFDAGSPASICTPDEGLSNDQVRRVVVKWIEGHPEQMHLPGRTAVLRALMDAFPCEGK